MEQLGSGHVRFAVSEELDVKDSLRRAERIRAAAVDSFHWIDSNEVLRRALHARSRPPKLEMIQEGTTVYVHSPPPHRRGQARRLLKITAVGMGLDWWCVLRDTVMSPTEFGSGSDRR